jgi:multidrug efflux pump subunit AcrB
MMRRVIEWGVKHPAAVNAILVAVLLIGGICMYNLRREEFPEFELEIILVAVPYPGASPEEIESGICQKIEEAVRAIDGIKKVTTVAQEGAGNVVLELESDVRDVQKVLAEVRSQVDRIPSFPLMAEDPTIQQITMRRLAIEIGVMGPETDDVDSEQNLRNVAEQVRDDLLALPTVSNVELVGVRPYQIDVEISENTLREYGLSLGDVAQTIRRENMELPGGRLITDSEEVLLRGNNKRDTGEGIAAIPLVTQQDGLVLTVGDLGTVRDAFSDVTAVSTINGRPGLVLQVNAGTREDLLKMTDEVKEFAKTYQSAAGYNLVLFGDRSSIVRDRLELLTEDGFNGLILVFLSLAIFLEIKLALWVALGIPIAILGSACILLLGGQTLNMLSMFSFLMVLGIVVDDGIVIGENIHTHRMMGKSASQAAIDGLVEVFPSVFSSVLMTCVAFVPMFFVSGIMGKFFSVMPLAVIATLVISLFETTISLPCHLAHDGEEQPPISRRIRNVTRRWVAPLRWVIGAPVLAVVWFVEQMLFPLRWLMHQSKWVNQWADRLITFFADKIYRPIVRVVLAVPFLSASVAVAILLLSVGFVRAGFVPWVVFPRIDTNWIEARVTFPDGTPAEVTDAATQRIEAALYDVDDQMLRDRDERVLRVTRRVVGQVSAQDGSGQGAGQGSHVGMVGVELSDTATRQVTAKEIINLWREISGEFPGAEKVTFSEVSFGPGGRPIEFKVLADAEHADQLEGAVDMCMRQLESYPGVFDVGDDSQPGKWEFQIRVRDDALAMGVTAGDLMETIRSSYYGDEVMRLQRGRHEVKLMVRYPPEERRSLADFSELRVRTDDGIERPITELADIQVIRGYSEINRLDQMRSITVSADLDEEQANAALIVADMQDRFMRDLLAEYPDVRIRWEGQQEQTTESIQSLFVGFGVAIAVMYVLLVILFNSYVQPVLVLMIIPFGMIGAVLGHWVLGLELTLFSVLGLVALSGVVVNDSIVLLEFINARVTPQMSRRELRATIEDCVCRRLRPVLLNSVTTVIGVMPIVMETSLQAQLVIPMAMSLAAGLTTTTFIVLLQLPAFFSIYHVMTHATPEDDEVVPDTVLHQPHGPSGNGKATEPGAASRERSVRTVEEQQVGSATS